MKVKKLNLKKSFNKKDIRVFVRAIAIVLAVLLVLSVLAYKIGHFSPLGLGRGISNFADGLFGNNGFPLKASSSDVQRMAAVYSDVALLNDTGVKVIDRSGKTLSDIEHNYSLPLMYSGGSNMLLIDAGGNKFRVQNSGKVIYEKEFDFPLMTGDISKNGWVAIASKSDQGASMLTVFNGKKSEVFSWVCAKEQIVCVDISDNGRYIAVGVIGADSGDIFSDVFLFDINYNEPIQQVNLPGVSVAKVEILSGKKMVVIGDTLVSFINEKGKRNDIDVSLNTVSRFYVSENNVTALVLSKYSSAYSNILNIYSSSGKEISSTDIDYQIKDMSFDGKHIAFLTDEKIICYDLYGRVSGEKLIDNDAISCCISGADTYVLFSNDINKFSVRGNSDEREELTTVENFDREAN